MKITNLFIILFLIASLSSCSSSKTNDDVEDGISDSESGDEDGGDFIVDSDEEEDDEFDGEEDEESVAADDEADELEEGGGEEMVADTSGSDPGGASLNNSGIQTSSSGEIKTYSVKRGDTLMLIAFKIYGTHEKWRELADLNGTQLLSVGTSLRYRAPASKFSWNPSGLPYLIRTGDTLGTISNDKYGTTSKWKDLWNNNRVMIKDPNLIFAGFTLYYIAGRDVASE